MSVKVFSIANQKGGVGKTTTAINLGVALARKNVRTLIIDLDPQANATSGLGVDKIEGASLYRCFLGDEDAADKIIATAQKNLSLIPAEVDLAAIEIELSQQSDYLIQLRRCLQPIRDQDAFDAIILDCPPALGMLSMNSLAAADFLLIALQCEYLALEGLSQILKVVDQLREAGVNSELAVGGILMTMFDIRTNLSRQVVQEVNQHFPELAFKTVIPRSIRLSEAPSFGQSIFDYDPHSPGAAAYTKLSQEIIRRFSLKG